MNTKNEIAMNIKNVTAMNIKNVALSKDSNNVFDHLESQVRSCTQGSSHAFLIVLMAQSCGMCTIIGTWIFFLGRGP